MRKTLPKPLYPITICRPHSSPINGGTTTRTHHPLHNPSIPDPNPLPLSNSRWVFTTTAPPPPEWVEPINDTSDLISPNPKPSPWVDQIFNLLNDDVSSQMEPKLDAVCRNWFIRLSPNFVCYILSSGRVLTRPELAFRFFNWAGSQKGGWCIYSRNLECYALLIDVLSGSKDVDRVKCVFNEVKNRGFVMSIKCANLLIKSFGNLGMVEELLWVWKEMKEHEIDPSLFTFNFLINGLVNSMFMESVEQVLEA
ncbi:putative tetratricopeptide-like helical domain superfamily [Helianthus annuus]|nr:putative tetratricopeptide-like helical domain superfamily [Helianthus annuus]KAJ0586544.1 putative tetratricopeptide-like helical domain superfamily [Helianthus annuus]KAJ0759727.1 putative tetratricopeptide-like helical domain superfamily [Helianthus annuus]